MLDGMGGRKSTIDEKMRELRQHQRDLDSLAAKQSRFEHALHDAEDEIQTCQDHIASGDSIETKL
jgi:hypothetical protein